ncbi:hypothetical protein BJX63DRAFT_391098 [Aspergillus granulosus]|uniref:Uncharacterized protein n=1 Tax=Aspergillus granulosus TaxID=176169 RepID=A0ABR4HIL2_9EURO
MFRDVIVVPTEAVFAVIYLGLLAQYAGMVDSSIAGPFSAFLNSPLFRLWPINLLVGKPLKRSENSRSTFSPPPPIHGSISPPHNQTPCET